MDQVVIDNKSTAKELLESGIDLKILIEFIKPNNVLFRESVKDFTKHSYQTISDILQYYEDGEVMKIIEKLTNRNEIEILNQNGQDFIKFVKWINNQIEIIIKLSNSLASSELDAEDMAFQNAGAEKLNKYKELMVYYSIDKNPANWKQIGNMTFETIFSKLLIDKDMADINKKYIKSLKK